MKERLKEDTFFGRFSYLYEKHRSNINVYCTNAIRIYFDAHTRKKSCQNADSMQSVESA